MKPSPYAMDAVVAVPENKANRWRKEITCCVNGSIALAATMTIAPSDAQYLCHVISFPCRHRKRNSLSSGLVEKLDPPLIPSGVLSNASKSSRFLSSIANHTHLAR